MKIPAPRPIDDAGQDPGRVRATTAARVRVRQMRRIARFTQLRSPPEGFVGVLEHSLLYVRVAELLVREIEIRTELERLEKKRDGAVRLIPHDVVPPEQ
jgi:hypothetical protein